MQYIIQTYSNYDPTKLGTPWGAPCDSTGCPYFKGPSAHFTGGRGKGGVLFAEDPSPDSVWVYGQKNYSSGHSEKRYVQFRDGVFRPVSEADLLSVLQFCQQTPDTAPKESAVKKDSLPPKAVTHHIRLSPQEDQILRSRAGQAGMALSPFIKQMALHGSVKILNLAPLTQHILILGDIAHDIRKAVSTPHPDRWLYQADLEGIEEKLTEMLRIEKDIQANIRHKIK